MNKIMIVKSDKYHCEPLYVGHPGVEKTILVLMTSAKTQGDKIILALYNLLQCHYVNTEMLNILLS